ncbi:sulfate anion transporter 1-like isoform X2 [Mizuhopecten yessoensis]|uniref:Sulfate anion transporter 1 n=1 Tax=Mizuhopecten yessoensis TaxID=6573 RepID=A0A210PLE1_MIZYE|nr:sulfate anion transporter 1-like isoform X2 [Mizuhopecten yessoensis]OWF37284.1 Sulfate anion transporter 1 [Mizuhopecten yessoensis]
MEMTDSNTKPRRTFLRVAAFDTKFKKPPEPAKSLPQRISTGCKDYFSKRRLIKTVYANFPFIRLIRKYNLKENLANDVISGLTVGIMQIPQGMAYALLGSLPPIVGLYTSFFGPLIYFFLGTSRHASMGTIAIVSLMIASVLDTRLGDGTSTVPSGTTSPFPVVGFNVTATPNYTDVTNTTTAATQIATMTSAFTEHDLQKIRITAALSFVSGFVMIFLGKINMGLVATYMSEPMVCGFTSAVAIHVTTSQAKHILGIKIGRHNGVFKVIKTWIDIFKNIATINWAPVITSIICILAIYAVKIHVNLRFKARLKIPIPIEIIVVSIATAISHVAKFQTNYDVNVLEDIPSGLPAPAIPDVTLVGESFKDAVIIGVVAFIQSVSMAKILARKNNYRINPNQEMIAYGAGSVLNAVFSGYIPAASVARSMVQEGAGGHTQVASLFGCLVVLVVIVAIGPLFYSLPKCVLSCVILVNLRSMFLQFLELKPLWRKSKYDFLIWIVTFLATVILDADIGIGIGIVFSILTVAVRTQRPEFYRAGVIDGQYLKSTQKYNEVQEEPTVKIVRFQAPLYFANGEVFVKAVRTASNMDPEQMKKIRKLQEKKNNAKNPKESTENGIPDSETGDVMLLNQAENRKCREAILLDMGGVAFLDVVGVKTLRRVFNEYNEIDVDIMLAGCSDGVLDILRSTDFMSEKEDFIYVDIESAIESRRGISLQD